MTEITEVNVVKTEQEELEAVVPAPIETLFVNEFTDGVLDPNENSWWA